MTSVHEPLGSDPIRLLVIEDNRHVAALYQEALTPPVFEARISSNGEDGLLLYDAWKPDIILLDILLPKISGYSLLRMIREERKDATTAIIMATALSSAEDVRDCARFAIQGYLVKPIDFRMATSQILHCYAKLHPEKARPYLESLRSC